MSQAARRQPVRHEFIRVAQEAPYRAVRALMPMAPRSRASGDAISASSYAPRAAA